MSKVCAVASMSLDGYIAGPGETGFDKLFEWYGTGDVAVPTEQPDRTFQMSEASAAEWHDLIDKLAVTVIGRRLFDLTDGWGGVPPGGGHVVVVTHRAPDDWPHKDAPYTFVTEGFEAAIATARSLAGDKWVGVNGGTIASQALNAGLLDEIRVALVPVLLGDGVPFLSGLKHAPVELSDPRVVETERVTHLVYQVRKKGVAA